MKFHQNSISSDSYVGFLDVIDYHYESIYYSSMISGRMFIKTRIQHYLTRIHLSKQPHLVPLTSVNQRGS